MKVWEVFILQCHVRNEQLVYAITFTVFHNWPKAYIIINDQHQTIYLVNKKGIIKKRLLLSTISNHSLAICQFTFTVIDINICTHS